MTLRPDLPVTAARASREGRRSLLRRPTLIRAAIPCALLSTVLVGCGPDGEAEVESPGGETVQRNAEPAEVRRTAWLMGTTLTARVAAAERNASVAATEAVLDEIGRLEGVISSWDSTTALGRLNRTPEGEPSAVPAELLRLLVRADSLAEATGRAFEPAVGPLVDAWGLRGEPRTPSAEERAAALKAVRTGFTFDVAAGTAVRRHPGAWIDTGAFGKGAALEAARTVLAEHSVERALLDFGGQALTVGSRADGEPWRIGVAHPARRDQAVTELHVGPGMSVATSGGSERPGHLLDPRSGDALPSWGSVTVASPDPVAADALATGLFVLGPDEAMAWADARDDVGVLVLEARADALVARWNTAMERWLDPNDPFIQNQGER